MVPLRQRNLFASAANICRTFQLSHEDRCLNVMPMFHIQGFMSCLLAPLMAGASIVCTSGYDAQQFFPWIERFQPTYYSASPTIHQAVIAGAAPFKAVIQRHPLRFIRSSAAPLPPSVMRELEETMQAPVIESYGMTEGALQSTSNPLPPLRRKPGSVGPAAGPQVVILDQSGTILPTGSRGEVAIQGASVMDGYLKNPEANRSAFVKGWFRTGDEGYLDEELYLHITGRLKEMINRGGEKVTPREVDEVFLAHPAIAQAVTFAVPHPSLGEDVATAVVLKENSSISDKELRLYALSRLSDLKAPSRVIILDELPKGSTGKLQRIGLHQVLIAHFQSEYVAPRNELEQKLVVFIQQLLSLPQVGIRDNFFSLGGDSLLAAGLSARVKEELQAGLSIEAIFRHPTVEELAVYIQEQRAAQPKNSQIDADILDYLRKM
jgi:acyl-CoA synthetase (AMP-forming)/AMP-acid ligase II/acyl carrier protein